MGRFFYGIKNPSTNPEPMITHEGNRVNANKQNVPMVNPKFDTVLSRGWNNNTAAAATSPAFAALIPSSEARMGLNFLRLSQIRMTKKIKKVPGRKMPAAAIIAPSTSPPTPYSRIDSAPR